jgi:Mn-containing catalase
MRTSRVEFIGTTISRLLDGSPGYNGKKDRRGRQAGREGATPLKSLPIQNNCSATC